jgi:hypothetical protein
MKNKDVGALFIAAIGIAGCSRGAADDGISQFTNESAARLVVLAEVEQLRADVPTSNAHAGRAVAVDGDTVIVGAPDAVSGGVPVGSAYVFVRESGAWVLEATLMAAGLDADADFGASVAIDGDLVVVGAPNWGGGDGGNAFDYTRTGGVWTEAARLDPPSTFGAHAGAAVAVDGDAILVGVPQQQVGATAAERGAVHAFRRLAGVWTFEAQLAHFPSSQPIGYFLGTSVALEGDTAILGAPQFTDAGFVTPIAGAAVAFTHGSGSWVFERFIPNPEPHGIDQFGLAVDVSGDTAVVGSGLDDDAGSESDQRGRAHTFSRDGGVWTHTQTLRPADDDPDSRFGASVAIAGDVVFIGAPLRVETVASGATYVFTRSGGTWTEASRRAHPPDISGVQFGVSVAFDGTTAVAGADFDNPLGVPNAGAAYVGIIEDRVEVGEPCTTNDECTTDFCADGVCCATACGGSAADCLACSVVAGSSTNGACEPVSDASACEDGDACTQGDECLAGVCEAGSPVVCSDGESCTMDTCDAASGCLFTSL